MMSSDNPHDTVLLSDVEDDHIELAPANLAQSPPDFARLVPVNLQSKTEFHRVATQASSDPAWCLHARKFLHIENTHSHETASNASTTDDEDPSDNLISGWYRLSLDRPLLPNRFAQGWVLGGCQATKLSTGIDFLLSLNGAAHDVSTRHAHILHHQVNHCLMLKVPRKKSVVLNGVEIQGREILLSEMIMGLTIGNLAYSLVFEEPTQTYRKRLQEILLESSYFARECHTSLDTTPSSRHINTRGYQFQTPNAFGSYGVISGCFRISDAAKLAVKRLRRTRQTFRAINAEIDIMKRLGTHVCIAPPDRNLPNHSQSNICSLVEVLYSDGDARSMGSRDINDVFVILTPYAPMTIRQFIDMDQDLEARNDAFRQGCEGIAFVHAHGIIHRDVKPGNLLIAESRPLRIIVADFGHSTTLTNCRDHMKGTISYLSPEILALKSGVKNDGYWSKACDVFSYGIVGYQIFHGVSRVSPNGMDKIIHRSMMMQLTVSGTDMDAALIKMLAWDFKQRPAIQDVLDMQLWSKEKVSVGQKRKRSKG